jgi:hypothetical protein
VFPFKDVTMAVSLALNWSPPPSSPLFDESTTPNGTALGNEAQSSSRASSSPRPDPSSVSTSMSNGQAMASSSSSPLLRKQQASTTQNNGLSVQSTPARTNSASPQPKSYAAAASHSQQAAYQMPSFPGPALTSQVSLES